MNKNMAKPQWEAPLRAYQVAVIAFNAASATLILHLAAESLPTAREVAAEENARAAVVAARRNLWASYKNAEAESVPAEAVFV